MGLSSNVPAVDPTSKEPLRIKFFAPSTVDEPFVRYILKKVGNIKDIETNYISDGRRQFFVHFDSVNDTKLLDNLKYYDKNKGQRNVEPVRIKYGNTRDGRPLYWQIMKIPVTSTGGSRKTRTRRKRRKLNRHGVHLTGRIRK
jgi:hypothetical protein